MGGGDVVVFVWGKDLGYCDGFGFYGGKVACLWLWRWW
jgi:hypothetical protein